MYLLRFSAGSRSGEMVKLKEPESLLGRSRSCDIRVMEGDVSGRHLSFSFCSEGIRMENDGSTRTLVNGQSLEQGGTCILSPGDVVQVGGTLAFSIEVDGVDGQMATGLSEDMSAPSLQETAPPPSQETALPVSHPSSETAIPPSGAPKAKASVSSPPEPPRMVTEVMNTKIAGGEELQQLRERNARVKTRRMVGRVLLGGMVFVAVAASYYFFVRQVPEKVLSWPKTLDGKYDIRQYVFDSPLGHRMIGLKYPGGPDCRISTATSGTFTVSIETRLGAKRDVPLKILLSCSRDSSSLRESRDETFARWRRTREESDGWNFQSLSPLEFQGEGHGLPFINAQYLRTIKTDADTTQWFGYLLFARIGDCVVSVSREIPAVEQWRGASVLATMQVLLTRNEVTEMQWEGVSGGRDASVDELLLEADGLLSRQSPLLWNEAEYILRCALIASAGDAELRKRVESRWRELRRRQSLEYARLLAAWERERRLGNLAGCKSIMASALKVFASPDDRRNDLLRKGRWK